MATTRDYSLGNMHAHATILRRPRAVPATATISNTPTVDQGFVPIRQGRYEAKIAANVHEITSALRLRHDVFDLELAGKPRLSSQNALESDAYDLNSRHLIVVDRETSATVGTYRLNTMETAGSLHGFYSFGEFTIEDLPAAVIDKGVEIGRACVALEYRNTKVLFLLWAALLRFLESAGKRYFFGCCSIFATDARIGPGAYRMLTEDGATHPKFLVLPRKNKIDLESVERVPVELPALFRMYLRLGAKVCGPPMIDHDFGTTDFFVLLDQHSVSDRYRRMFSVV